MCYPMSKWTKQSHEEVVLTSHCSASKGGHASHSGGFASMDPDKQVRSPLKILSATA